MPNFTTFQLVVSVALHFSDPGTVKSLNSLLKLSSRDHCWELHELKLPLFELLIIHLIGDYISCPHCVASRERVKIHAHFPHVCGTYCTIDTSYLLCLKGKRLPQGERVTPVECSSGLSAVRDFVFV